MPIDHIWHVTTSPSNFAMRLGHLIKPEIQSMEDASCNARSLKSGSIGEVAARDRSRTVLR